MAKLNIIIDAPVSALDDYADQLGYQDTVVTNADENGNDIREANPESKREFLQRKVSEEVAEKLAENYTRTVKKTKEQEFRTARDANIDTIKSRITTSLTV